MAITDKKISEVYSGRDISSLSDNPNQDGMSASSLKARFDQLGKEIIPKYNGLIDELNETTLPSKIDLNGINANIDRLQFNTATLQALNAVGQIRWNDTERTLELRLSNDVTLQIGKETLLRATNKELTTIPNGKACYISGGAGGNVHTKLATNTDGLIAQATIGVATEDLISNESGYICTEGIVGGINTDSWNEGDILYLGISGALVNVEPVAPTPKIFVGVVLRKHLSLGSIYVKVRAVPRLQRLSDVLVSSIADGHALIWNGTTGRFENEAIYNKAEVDALANVRYTKTEVNNLLNATNIANTPSGNISSTTVQGAINELDTEKVDKLFATNLVQNGDFSNGTTGWIASSGLMSVLNNTLQATGVGTSTTISIRENRVATILQNGRKEYARVRMRVRDNQAQHIRMRLYGGLSDTTINTPVQDQWYEVSAIMTGNPTSEATAFVRFQPFATYADSATTNGKVFEIERPLIIDLTATFGAGNEPTKEQMDKLLLVYPNSWFNGTVELMNYKQLLDYVIDLDAEKVDKVTGKGLSAEDYTTAEKAKVANLPLDTNAQLADIASGVKLDTSAVKYEKTDFITIGKNIYDKDKAVNEFYVNQTNGNLDANVNYAASDYCPVSPNTVMTQSRSYHTAFYDEAKKYISGLAPSAAPANPRAFTTPANARYMRSTCLISQKATYQIELGSQATDYEDFGYQFIKPYAGIKPVINLPPTIQAVVGKEVNIYFANIIENYKDYNIEVAGSVGKHQAERWTAVPLSETTTPIVISLYDKSGVLVTSASTSLVVKAATVGNAVNKKCLFIGDSTTAAGKYTQELLNLFNADVMDVTLLGTLGVAPNLHEGRSGWTTDMYCNTASFGAVVNPFYNNGFDFAYYMASNPTIPDVVAIHLGINDIFNDTTDVANDTTIANVLARFDTMVNSIKAYSAGVKVALMITIPPSISQDAFGDDYANNQSLWRYRRNYFRFVKALIAKYKGLESSGIYLVPINVNLDTVNNMQSEEVAVNSRNPKVVTRQNNGVHPADNGYYQMADSLYYWLKSFEI